MTRLKVGVRLRPLSSRELENAGIVVVSVESGNTVAVTNVKVPEQNAGDSRERIRRFTFDFCLEQNSTQEDTYKAVESVVGPAVKRRCNSCVLAYGQSSTGKTHTMIGLGDKQGIIPNICRNIFGYLQETAVGDECGNIRVAVSYLEIYNEKVRDLLGGRHKSTLKIRQHPKKGPYVQNLSEHRAENSQELLELLEKGTHLRHVGSTLSNPRSSRSHSVFVIQFDGIKLTLVDLAGSERAGNRCYGSSTFKEGANINKSLVALGNVISALAEDNKYRTRKFVPYRDSVLTWLLKDTLGGNSETIMIATISPSSTCYSETVNTLRFGQRAKLIVSIPVVKENPTEKIISELRAEIARLKEILAVKFSMEPKEKTLQDQDTVSEQESKQLDAAPLNSTETLIPFVEVSPQTKPTKLRRTFSVEHPFKKMEESNKKFGSEETITKKNIRKSSIEKTPTKFLAKRQSELKMSEKSISTDYKSRVEPKVDSIRKTPIKPRSQIVAAVTNRLYSKIKKKEVATDTSDIAAMIEPPKELTICSNARLKLKELTRRALKAHRSRNEETQTDLFPVLRVKEISTDVNDLKVILLEAKNAETSTHLETEDRETSCDWLCSFKSRPALTLTKSCGTQFQNSVSFTKYLQDLTKPTYTSTVNVNVSTLSDDSLEDQNVCFPTPDLISNHNSLEPSHATECKIKHANDTKEEFIFHQTKDLYLENPFAQHVGACGIVPKTIGDICNIHFADAYAAQIFLKEDCFKCQNFWDPTPKTAKANLVDVQCYYLQDCIQIREPVVLKSIMKFNICEQTEEMSEEESNKQELPDSLEYHAVNNSKRVRFHKKRKNSNERLIVAISNFMEEATKLLNNLSPLNCDVHVTFDEERKFKTDNYVQTEPNWDFLQNKYEHVLEESCQRLEEKIRRIHTRKEEEYLYNHQWEAGTNEDFSLGSLAATSSDYGSLPSRKYRSSCSPSAYLRQLANMRRHVVESSRENLYNF